MGNEIVYFGFARYFRRNVPSDLIFNTVEAKVDNRTITFFRIELRVEIKGVELRSPIIESFIMYSRKFQDH